MEQREFIVEAEGAGQRIDRFPAVRCKPLWPKVTCCATARPRPRA